MERHKLREDSIKQVTYILTEAHLDVVGVLAHAPRLVQLRADDRLARVELLARVVQVDEPVPPLERRQVGS